MLAITHFWYRFSLKLNLILHLHKHFSEHVKAKVHSIIIFDGRTVGCCDIKSKQSKTRTA